MSAVGPFYYSEEELMEEERPVVVYCLYQECHQTAWLNSDEWGEDKERSQMIVEGEPSMMGPYCPEHKRIRETML